MSEMNPQDRPPLFRGQPLEAKHVGHASLHANRQPHPLTREELSMFKELPDELTHLVYTPDPEKESAEGVLVHLEDLAKKWAREEGMTIDDMVIAIQQEHNTRLDIHGIYAAIGIARDALDIELRGGVPVDLKPKSEVISVPLRDGVSSVVKYIQGNGEERYEVLTSEQRAKRGVTALTVYERQSWIKRRARGALGRVSLPNMNIVINSEILQGQGENDD